MSVIGSLNQIAEDEGVLAVALVGEDGFVIESVRKDGAADIDFVGGAATAAMASSKALADHLNKGDVKEVMVEYNEGPLLMIPIKTNNSEYTLVMLLDDVQNLGRIRFQLKKTRATLEEELS